MKKCPICDHEADEEDTLCVNCGYEFPQAGQLKNEYYTKKKYPQRSLLLYILLSFWTGGLFLVYWMWRTVEDLRKYYVYENLTSGFMYLFLSMITFNLYSVYYFYCIGELIDKEYYEAQNDERVAIGQRKYLYAVLAFLGLGFMLPILIQMELGEGRR